MHSTYSVKLIDDADTFQFQVHFDVCRNFIYFIVKTFEIKASERSQGIDKI